MGSVYIGDRVPADTRNMGVYVCFELFAMQGIVLTCISGSEMLFEEDRIGFGLLDWTSSQAMMVI